MAFTNFETREINCKVIYFGPRAAGKTENLRALLAATSPDIKNGLLQLDNSQSPTRFFDFLPVSVGKVKDFHLKIHLFTLPPNPLYESVSSVILKGVDGYVFVADSRIEAMADNIQSLDAARRLLTAEGYNVADMPKVIQYNKRDLPGLVPLETLRQELNAAGVPDQKAIASQGIGTLDTLQAMTKLIMQRISA